MDAGQSNGRRYDDWKRKYTEQILLDEIDKMDMEAYLKEYSGVKHIDRC